MTHTQSRTFQWLGIIILAGVFGGAYWYFQVRASTLNQSQNDLVTNGLVGLWSFNGDDISGTTAYDRSSTGANGTLTGGPAKIVGKVGQAIDVDGTDDYLSVADNAALDFGDTADLSIAGWFYRDTFTTDDTIIAKRNGIAAGDTGYLAYIDDSTDQLIFEVSDGTDEYSLTSTATFTATGWYHYAIVWDQDSATNSEIYIDGVANVATDSGTIGNIGDLGNAVVLAMGTESDVGNPFDGKIDEVRVYNRALSANEIQSLYTQGGGTKSNTSVSQAQGTGRLDSGLAGYWKLDETSGSTAVDSSTGGNNGTAQNMEDGDWTTGQIGGALDFDGTNETVTTAKTVPSRGSLSAWVNTTAAIDNCKYNDIFFAQTSGSLLRLMFVGCSSFNNWEFVMIGGYGATNTPFGPTYSSNSQQQGWHLITATWDTALGSSLYIDGALADTDTTATNPFGSMTLTLGGAAGEYFPGKIDDARLYDRILSADEVAQLYRLTAPTGIDTGLKGYWSFNGQDVSGTTAYDRSGAGNTGTLTGGPTKAIGIVGQALSLDGSDDYVLVNDADSLDAGTGSFTYGGYFKTTSTSNQRFISKRTGASAPFLGYESYIRTDGKVVCTLDDNSATFLELETRGAFNDGAWHQALCVVDRTGGALKIYVDGRDQTGALISGTNALGGFGTLSNSANLYLGRYSVSSDQYFTGRLDEMRVYNRALTASEIQGQYDAANPDKGNSSASQAQGTGRLDSGLAGYWKLDETTGSSAADASTNGNNGTAQNMENGDWTTGQIGNGLTFDGADEYVDAGTSNSLRPTGALTLSVWVQSTADVQVVLGSRGSGSTGGFSFITKQSGNTVCRFTYFGVADWDSASGCSLYEGLWHHYVVTTDATTAVKFYRDGAFQSQNNTAVSSGTASDQRMVLGALQNTASVTNFLNGKLDEVRIYNRVLSDDEVAQLYRLTTPMAVDTGLKGYWSFNGQDMNGTTAYDRSGAGNTGTLTGGPTKVPGKIGQGLSFDGTDDYTIVPDNSALDFGANQDFSIAMWLKTSDAPASTKPLAKYNVDTAGLGWGLYLTYTALFLKVANGTSVEYESSIASVNDGSWHHVVYSITRSGNCVKYKDGAAVGSDSCSSWVSLDLSNANDLYIGANIIPATYFNGTLDEVRIYKRALTAAEVAALYNQSR